jgi:hypothetical protein
VTPANVQLLRIVLNRGRVRSARQFADDGDGRDYPFGATTAFCAGLSEINYGHHHHPQIVVRGCNSLNGRLVRHRRWFHPIA